MSTLYVADTRIPTTEVVGPKTNSRTVSILHPDMHVTHPDAGRTRVTERQVDKSVYLPNHDLCNVVKKSPYKINKDNELEAKALYDIHGRLNEEAYLLETDAIKAKYLKDNYGVSNENVGTPAVGDKPLIYADE